MRAWLPRPPNEHLASRFSCEVAVRVDRSAVDALQVLALDQILDAPLEHVHLGLELAGQLRNRLGDQLLVRQLLALSVRVSARSVARFSPRTS